MDHPHENLAVGAVVKIGKRQSLQMVEQVLANVVNDAVGSTIVEKLKHSFSKEVSAVSSNYNSGLTEEQVRAIVDKSIEKPFLGLLGTEKVNVLKLNIALEESNKSVSYTHLNVR